MPLLIVGVAGSVHSNLSELLGPATWWEAEMDCQSRGQTLLRLSNPDKEKYLVGGQHIDSAKRYVFWNRLKNLFQYIKRY